MSARPDYAWGSADAVLAQIETETVSTNGAANVGAEAPGTSRRLIEPISASDLLLSEIKPPSMLIDELWSEEGCGYLAGEPKCLKTFTIFEMALAIVTGTKVFDHFAVGAAGPVLVFLEETKRGEAKQRLERLMRGRGLEPDHVSGLTFVIQNRIRLDNPQDQDQIRGLCQTHQPRMVFFDPLARMREGGSENHFEDLNIVLGFLRGLQSEHHTSVGLSHHMTKPNKDGSQVSRSGHRIRGTGDQYAWMDCAMYFTRGRASSRVQVEVEHREAAEPEPFTIGLQCEGEGPEAAFWLDHSSGELVSDSLMEVCDRILAALKNAPRGLNVREVHKEIGGRGEDVQSAIRWLEENGQIEVREEKRPDSKGTNRRCKVLYLKQARNRWG